jgi:O-antigen/teichoic acid export membrane protein
MSRFRNAARSLTSGYVALAANGVYLLASYPLALSYLSAQEFALWALVVQIAGYLLLIDFGITGAVCRILIDHKDNLETGTYGAVLKTGVLALFIQGVCIILGGILLAIILTPLLDVPPQFRKDFQLLIAGQCFLLGGVFAFRIFMSLLQAHQRFDVINYAQVIQLVAGFAIQWLTFHLGWGLYSLLAASAVNAVLGAVHNLIWVWKLKLFPAKRYWGKPSLNIFKELFAFGKDLFLLSIGLQLINASQVVIITRTLGLTAAAVWTIATKTFLLAQQIVARISDFSSSALGEMVVRAERERLQRRFRELLTLTASVAVFAGASIAVCNGSFIAVWLKGGPHSFATSDIKDFRSFTLKLQNQADPIAGFLWSQISNSTREMIRTNATEGMLQPVLVSDLNHLIQPGTIFQPERFSTVSLSPETKSLLNRDLPRGWHARLNRLLLEDAFPDEIERSIRFSTDWPWRNDVLLGLLLIVTSVTRCNISLTGQTKQIGAMRYVYFFEGILFVTMASVAAPRWGMTGILVAAVLTNILCSGAYGFWRTARYFSIPMSEPLLTWLSPGYRYLIFLTPIAVLLGWGASDLFVIQRFFLCFVVLVVIGALLLWIGGLTKELRLELRERFMSSSKAQ